MADKIKWGILSTGKIARKFVHDLKQLPDAQIWAVGSRHQDSADAFADEFDIPRRYDSYDKLAGDPDVDVIYIATPHPYHAENSLMCLKAGKAVLCEKPFALNTQQAEEVIAYARDHKLFIMEAIWSRFIPLYREIRNWVRDGAIGDVRMLTADFGFRRDFDPASRLFDPKLGGGALLDVGIYTIELASWIFGRMPVDIQTQADIGESGIDEQSTYLLKYERGALALLAGAIRTETRKEAFILGTKGYIHIHAPFWHPFSATVIRNNEAKEVELRYEGYGYGYEALEVMDCLRKRRSESEIMPLSDTMQSMQIMDEIRRRWGLQYPGEKES